MNDNSFSESSRGSILQGFKKVLYNILKIEDFKKFFNNFSTTIMVLILGILLVSMIYISVFCTVNGNLLVIFLMIFLGVWILLFVSTTLKEVVTQEIKESIEQEVFDRLSVIEKITLRNEKMD